MVAALSGQLGRPLLAWPVLGALTGLNGCQLLAPRVPPPPPPPRTVVVAPVLNLSGSDTFDPYHVTDLIASELTTFPGMTVIPINRTLGELAAQGKTKVETPAEAIALARAFSADATLVAAVTEYDPYEPPTVGLIMQWYEPVMDDLGPQLTAPGPRYQAQRVFSATDETVRDEIKHFAAQRDANKSPYGWRRWVQSQELYVRYCGWALIRTMLKLDGAGSAAGSPSEAES